MITMEEEFNQIQNSLKDKVEASDKFNKKEIKTVAGVDLAYWKENEKEYAVCCIVVIDFAMHNVIEKRHCSGEIIVPYIPGYLAFRELSLVLKTVDKLESIPDIYMFDGNGYLHPRHMGIASQASFYLNKPTIGVAKTYYRADKKTDFIMPDIQQGSYTDIVIDNEVYGRALRTHANVKPVFLSIGNYISIDTAMEITMQLVDSESHIPIPTRLADLETHIKRTEITNN